MTTTIATADFGKLQNTNSDFGCFTAPIPAAFPQVPIGSDSPLFKLAVLISRGFERLFGPTALIPDRVEESDGELNTVFWPCCC